MSGEVIDFQQKRESRGLDDVIARMQQLTMIEFEIKKIETEYAGIPTRRLDPELQTRRNGLFNRMAELYNLLEPREVGIAVTRAYEMLKEQSADRAV